jgi:predicted DNA-binding ribbon-helix-helix protein
MKKRSVTLAGHPTSVSLEDEFWVELKRIAAEAGLPLAALVARIDSSRGSANLSSALRLAVLADLKAEAKVARPLSGP